MFKDKRLDSLERMITETMRSYQKNMFRNDMEYLNSIARLYVEYNHKLKCIRTQNNARILRNARQLKRDVFAVLDAQDDEDFVDLNLVEVADPRRDFVEADFNSEIVFNAQTTTDEVSMILPAQARRRTCSEKGREDTLGSKRAVVEQSPRKAVRRTRSRELKRQCRKVNAPDGKSGPRSNG